MTVDGYTRCSLLGFRASGVLADADYVLTKMLSLTIYNYTKIPINALSSRHARPMRVYVVRTYRRGVER